MSYISYSELGNVRNIWRSGLVRGWQLIVIDPKRPERLFERGTSEGRTIFDHSWVERFFVNPHERAMRDLASLEIQSSGYGEPHIETRRKAEEISKWRPFFVEF